MQGDHDIEIRRVKGKLQVALLFGETSFNAFQRYARTALTVTRLVLDSLDPTPFLCQDLSETKG